MIMTYVASVLALTAIIGQWWENRQMRLQLLTTTAAQTAALEKQTAVIQAMQSQRHEERRLVEQSCRMQVRWMAEMRETFAQLNASQGTSEAFAKQSGEERRYNQWNAQSIVSVFNSAASAGADWRGKSRDKLVEEVLVGMSPVTGPFAGKTFRVPNFSLEEAYLCAPFIALDAEKGLIFDQSGKQPSPGDDSTLTPIAVRKPMGRSSSNSPSSPPAAPPGT
jgi:hypothetical protein